MSIFNVIPGPLLNVGILIALAYITRIDSSLFNNILRGGGGGGMGTMTRSDAASTFLCTRGNGREE